LPEKPCFSPAAAAAIAREHYGLEVSAQPLPGIEDLNFHLQSETSEFVLKIHTGRDGVDLLEFQHQAMAVLADRMGGEFFPRPVADLAGREIGSIETVGNPALVRLLTWVPGIPLAQASPQSPHLLRELGRFLGKMSCALADFSHPAMHHHMIWDLRDAALLRDKLSHLRQPNQRHCVSYFLKRFESHVLPAAPQLRTRVVHHDANDYNLLVRPAGDGDFVPAGLIDFGDMVHAWVVSECAVAAAYVALGKSDPLTAAAHLVAGFHEHSPLTEREIALLFDLICMRLCFSGVLCAYKKTIQPENTYLDVTTEFSWPLLEKLRSVHPDEAHYRFRLACGLEPCPRTTGLVDWLETQPRFSPVMDIGSAPIVFDFTAGSPDSGGETDFDNVDEATRYLFGRMRAAGTSAGIGRYNEDRVIYKSDVFKPAGDSEQWRTVHLGIDLFTVPGTEIRAPLTGTVHSFRDNDNELDYGPTIVLQHEYPGGLFFTLYGHLSRDSLAGLFEGKTIASGSVLARVGESSVNGGWAPHLHFQIMPDMLGREGDFAGVASREDLALYRSLCPDPNLILRLPHTPRPDAGDERLLARRRRYLGPSLSLAYRTPLHMVRGAGAHLYDAAGRRYLDLVNNVCHVGHCHPRVVAAIREQSARLNTNTRYLHEYLVDYAERLCATLPEPLRVCFFVCSGSEANDLALRLARAHTKRQEVIVIEGAYHGHTSACIELSPYKFNGSGGSGPAPHISVVPMPDAYRGRHRADMPEAGKAYAAYVARAGAEMANGPAAFFAEPILGCGGQMEPPPDYLRQAFAHVREAGGLCVADEVQVGFGRVGSHFWAFESQDAVPDILTLGNPSANGHPRAAVLTTAEIAASFANGMEYFNTFGGNPVACAAGLAVLDVMRDEGLQAHAQHVGNHLKQGLRELQARHEHIGDVRGRGLFLGIDLVTDRESRSPAAAAAETVVEGLKQRGILISSDGPHHNVLKIKPPLVIAKSDIDAFLETLDEELTTLTATAKG